MQRTWEAISRIARFALWGDSSQLDRKFFAQLTDEEWTEMHALSVRQGICAILLDGIIAADIDLPRSTKMRFISSTDKIEKEYMRKRQTLAALAKVYADNNIDTMILKGFGLSLLYPKPEHRPSSDIDIYLFGKQHEADTLLRERYNISVDEGRHHHTVFHIKGVMVENHFDFIESNSRLSAKRIEAILKNDINQTKPTSVEVDGTRLFLPSPEMNALFLIIHTGAHFAAENVSLRHLTDWAMFLARHGKDVDWAKIGRIADSCGFAPFLACLNSLCVYYIGMPAELAPTLTDNQPLVERVLADCMEYKLNSIPKHFVKGWFFRLRRRFANRWKQRMVYNDSEIGAFFRSFIVHITPPSLWKNEHRS